MVFSNVKRSFLITLLRLHKEGIRISYIRNLIRLTFCIHPYSVRIQ